MIEIIKQGTIPEKRIRRFRCRGCGTKFKTDEYVSSKGRALSDLCIEIVVGIITVNCPTCAEQWTEEE